MPSREEAAHLRRIERFAAARTTGDRADLADVPEDAPVWAHATSTRDNCLGQSCPDYDDCFVMRARRNALAADVVVVNHHLFFADVVLRDEGVAELLPACNTVIFDEAHQLPETARLFFGETVSTTQLVELARDARARAARRRRRLAGARGARQPLEKAARDLRLALGETASAPRVEPGAAPAGLRRQPRSCIQQALSAVREPLEAQAERSEGLGGVRAPRGDARSPTLARHARDRARRRGALGRGLRATRRSCT